MRLGFASLCGVLLSAVLNAAEPLPVEALLDMTRLGGVDVSPDGQWVAVVLNVPTENGSDQATRRMLQLIDVRTGDIRNLGPLGVSSDDPSWSRDSTKLAFQVGEKDDARLWIWSRAMGQTAEVSTVPIRDRAGFVWTPDSKQVATVVLPEGVTAGELVRRSGGTHDTGRYPLDDTTPGARVAVYRGAAQNGRNLSLAGADTLQDYPRNNSYLGDIAVVDPATGAHRRIAVGYRPVAFRISPNGKQVSFTSIIGQAGGSAYRNLYDLIVAGIDGGKPRVLAHGVSQTGIHMDASWSPRSDALAYQTFDPGKSGEGYIVRVDASAPQRVTMQDRSAERYFNNRAYRTPLWDRDGAHLYTLGDTGLWRTNVAERVARKLTAVPGKRIVEVLAPSDGGRFASPDGGRSATVITRDETTKDEGFYRIDLRSGSTVKLTEGARRHGRTPFYRMDASEDGQTVVFAAESADATEQLWVSDPSFERPRQLTQLNPQLARYAFGRSRLISWRGPDGAKLLGALLLPPGHSATKRYPLIVNIYGDKTLSDEVNSFGIVKYPSAIENMQLFATRGYVVLRPDTITRPGTPMPDIAASVLPAVDQLIEDSVVDPQRLGIMGHSFGGYSTLATIVQTTRFKAALVSAGTANLAGVYSQLTPAGTNWKISWAEESQAKMGGALWEYRERYIENSPLFLLDRISTPVLIMHGTEDTAVPVHMGDEIFNALRRLGKPVEYAKYIGEPHVVMGRANSIDYANRMIGWFDRYLRSAATDSAIAE